MTGIRSGYLVSTFLHSLERVSNGDSSTRICVDIVTLEVNSLNYFFACHLVYFRKIINENLNQKVERL